MPQKPVSPAFQAAGNEVRFLKNAPSDLALLERGLKELCPPNFEECEANEAIGLIEKLKANQDSRLENTFVFLVSGTNLDDTPNAIIKGLSIGLLFPSSQTGSVWYLVTDEKYRQQGVARVLVFATARALKDISPGQQELKGLFVQIHDPDMADVAARDPFDSRKRVAFYHKLGARRIQIPCFFSPVLNEDGSRGESFRYMLVAVPQAPGAEPALTKNIIRSHIIDYYGEYGYDDADLHPDFLTMDSQLSAVANDQILKPLLHDGGKKAVAPTAAPRP